MENNLSLLKKKTEDFLNSDSGYATATKVVLVIIAITGIFFVAATAPNVFQAFESFRRSKKYSKKELNTAFYTLKRGNFIKVIYEKNDKIKIELTNKGKKRIKEFSIDSLSISQPKHWDRKWRAVIFDIPNRFTRARNALRNKLKDLNFFQLQKSVWVYPYDCEDEILFVANVFQIEPFVEILTVEKILHENKIRTFFKI